MRLVTQEDYRRILIEQPDGTIKAGWVDRSGRLYFNPPAQGQRQAGGQNAGLDDGTGLKLQRRVEQVEDIPKDLSFKQRLASILKDNSFNRLTRNLKRGRLDMKRLYKVGVKAENVFQRKTERRGRNYNVVLCVDESGSMSGANIRQAALVAGFLADNFQELKIDLAVMGYSNSTEMRKQFNENIAAQVVQKRVIGNFMGNGTNDHLALRAAYKLCRDRDGQSLVVVITDGQGMPSKILRPIIEANKSNAKTFAVGINADTPGYPQGVRANNLDELKPLVLNIIKSQVHRG